MIIWFYQCVFSNVLLPTASRSAQAAGQLLICSFVGYIFSISPYNFIAEIEFSVTFCFEARKDMHGQRDTATSCYSCCWNVLGDSCRMDGLRIVLWFWVDIHFTVSVRNDLRPTLLNSKLFQWLPVLGIFPINFNFPVLKKWDALAERTEVVKRLMRSFI